jgi:hypothetical protein
MKRDPSPVNIPPSTPPLARPDDGTGKVLLLYSGNWGVAHDYATFADAYCRHHREGTGRVLLWLNAVGPGASRIAEFMSERDLPLVRGAPVALSQLANLLVTPDAHLITLSDAFVGFVLPSKVYGCILSERPILFIGSARSDVHRLCDDGVTSYYQRVDVGNSTSCVAALERLADHVEASRNSQRRSVVVGNQRQEPI